MMLTKATMGFCLGLAAVLAPPLAWAEDGKPAPAPAVPAAPAQFEPKAIELLKAASAALAGAKTLSFDAVATYERAAANGQPLFYSTVSQVKLRRPDRLRVITLGDGTPDEVYYDGKEIAAFIPSANLVAIADAPPTVDKLLDHLWDKAAIYFPFADVLSSDPYADLSKGLQSAFYVGRSIAVGGVKTDVVAVAGEDAAAQIWIGAEDHLLRLIRVVYAHEPAHSLYQTEFSNWKLGEDVEETAFKSEKAHAARRIEFAPPGEAKHPGAPHEAPKSAPSAPAETK